MRVISLTNATSVVEPVSGETYDAGSDGVFDLPHDFAAELAAKHASQWRIESAHEAAIAAAKVEQLRNPHVLPAAVAKLRDDLDAALGRIDALDHRLAETAARAAQAAPAQESDGQSSGDATVADAEQPEPERKPTAARKTAAKKIAAKATQAKPAE